MTKTLLLAGILACAAAAQPPVIRVIPNGSSQAYSLVKTTVNVIAISAVSGPLESWLLELHDSFGSLEDLDKALSNVSLVQPAQPGGLVSPNAALSPPRAFVGTLRPGLSYLPEQWMQDLPKTRYLDVAIYHIRPDGQADFAKFLKARRAKLSGLNLDRPAMVYQIISGEPVGTFIDLTALPALRVLDGAKPAIPVYAEDTELAGEHSWFRIDPRVSYVSDEFASGDAEFWRSRN